MSAARIAHVPTPQEVEQARTSSRTLSKYATAHRVQWSLRAGDGEADDLILPGPVLQILLDVLAEMAKGNAISVMSLHEELSTQEAAKLLNVRRPFLVGLLEQNRMPFRKVGAHRQVLLRDVLAYKEQIDAERHKALDELGALSQQAHMGY